jgi:hypothetical protein
MVKVIELFPVGSPPPFDEATTQYWFSVKSEPRCPGHAILIDMAIEGYHAVDLLVT